MDVIQSGESLVNLSVFRNFKNGKPSKPPLIHVRYI